MSVESRNETTWWQSAVIYEIALISFQDSNGDGKGDLAGLMSRIDYLRWLGIDAVWLTPIYKKSFRDLGYDILQLLLHRSSLRQPGYRVRRPARSPVHQAGIRLILDLVPNHTANDLRGFVESASSPNSAKADWVRSGPTRPRTADLPPNN